MWDSPAKPTRERPAPSISGGDALPELPERVRDLVRDRLEDGACVSQVARKLGLSQRTLQRRLGELGTTFSALVRKEREHCSRKWLGERRMSMQEISERLGYSDASAFSRAFKRWTGLCPIQYQKRSAAGEDSSPDGPLTRPASPLGARDICQVIALWHPHKPPLSPPEKLTTIGYASAGAFSS